MERVTHIIAGFHADSEEELHKMLTDLREHAQAHRAHLREQNLLITKQSLRDSVTPDAHLVHAITAIEELDKVSNTLTKRLRDWYALYNPELEHAERDHKEFVIKILAQPSRSSNGMGGYFSEEDLAIVHSQAQAAFALTQQRERLVAFLEAEMAVQTPNLKRVAGATIGAKLLAMAGSLQRLSRMPAGTIQLLGAETALFRHLRNRNAKPPKHGVIFNHQIMQRAPKHMRGKVARTLADTISIAARIDFFKGEFMGDELLAKVEARLGGKS